LIDVFVADRIVLAAFAEKGAQLDAFRLVYEKQAVRLLTNMLLKN
jgi:hypothetical protein